MSSREAAMEEGTLYRFQEKTSSLHSPRELYRVAEFMNRDPDLWIFRSFGTLQNFNILSIQQRLTALEGKFQQRISSSPQLSCNDLIPDIQHTLKEYNDALAAQARTLTYLKPEAHLLDCMEEWSQKNEPALRNGLKIRDNGKDMKDIAAIGATEKTLVHKFIDRHRHLRSLFEEEQTTGNKLWSTLIYYEASVRRAEAIFIHVGFCVLLLCPVIALLYLESKMWKVVVLVVFMLAISVLSVGFLNTPNKAGLALVAGYAAILVVFLSSNVGA